MNNNNLNINFIWAKLIIEELTRHGINYFCIAPGSRSTPLTAAAALHPKIKTLVHYDERGLAFHALGNVRATGKPAALICTSGTAVANFLPAVVEASQERLPLVLLTADRPPELRNCGANQTITQPGIFSHYVRFEHDLPCPDSFIEPKTVLGIVDSSLHSALSDPPGPVHLNCPFRDPLEPETEGIDVQKYLTPLTNWQNSDKPHTASEDKPHENNIDYQAIADILNQTDKGIIVIGQLSNESDHQSTKEIAQKLGWPVFPDITSGLRLSNESSNNICYFDQILQSEAYAEKLAPRCVLHLGNQFVSKRLLNFLNDKQPENYIMVTDHSRTIDPNHQVTHRLTADLKIFSENISPLLKPNIDSAWRELFIKANHAVGQIFDQHLSAQKELHEPQIARLISELAPPDSRLHLASSMPVRTMDMFGSNRGPSLTVTANRGASGIDGTIATASGIATGGKKPITLLIGDLAFLHDLNSLALLEQSTYPVTVVVLNNHGGGIFSHLPIHKYSEIFDKYFHARHDYDFSRAADMFHLPYADPGDIEDFVRSYRLASSSSGSTIIEITLDHEANLRTYEEIKKAIIDELEKLS